MENFTKLLPAKNGRDSQEKKMLVLGERHVHYEWLRCLRKFNVFDTNGVVAKKKPTVACCGVASSMSA